MAKKKIIITKESRAEFEGAMDRLRQVSGCSTQVQLADFLGIRQSSISDAKRRCSIPAEWLLRVWRKTRISPDWIMYGKDSGHKLAMPADADGMILKDIDPGKLRREIKAELIQSVTMHLGRMA